MPFDWLRSLRPSRSRRRRSSRLANPTPLESRTLLSVAPIGGETKANSYTTGSQNSPAVAVDADGDYVVTWQSSAQDGSSSGIYAQRYNADGAAQGIEFRVNSYTTNIQGSPAIGLDANGDFVIAWASYGQDGSGWGIYAQRYNSDGVAQGTEFRVNSTTANQQSFPAIALDADGDFVVTWTSNGQDGNGDGIYARRYNAVGVAQGGEFRVNTFTTGEQSFPAIGLDAEGDFVITWQSYGQDGNGDGIFAQRYNATGVAQGAEFRVNSTTTDHQSAPAIALDLTGDFVITWTSNAQDGSGYGVYAQRYNAAGAAQGTEFRVNSYTTNQQDSSAIGMDADGDFIITWESYGQDGNADGTYARRYNAAGTAQGIEFRINTYTAGDQYSPAIGLDADGDFVVAWTSSGQDGSGYGVYAQPYRSLTAGAETRVNTYTTSSQITSAVAIDANGDYVVTWLSSGQDGSSSGVYAQRYNAAGVAQGTEFRVNSYTTGDQAFQAIGMDADGDFVITWRSNGQDGNGDGIYAQRYNALGVAQGTEFRVNTFTTGGQSSPAIGVDADGDFVITWYSIGQDGSFGGIYAQRYNAAGIPQGTEFRVNSTTAGSQDDPAIGIDADGDFVISWNSVSGGYSDIYAQRYNAAGVAQGTEFRANSYTTGHQSSSAIALDADGDFVIAWQSNGQDGDGFGIYARRYSPTGVAQGTEFRVNSSTSEWQLSPTIGLEADGDFVIAWESDAQDGDGFGVYAQRYNAAGIVQGPEFQVNSTTTHDQDSPAIGVDADGDFVITWTSYGQNGIGSDIYSQQYRLNALYHLPNAVGVWRAGKFYLDANNSRTWNNTAGGDQLYAFGSTTDTPLLGDWNGDRITDIGVWRAGKFYLDANANHVWNGTAAGDYLLTFGAATDLPLTGDWNGDGITDIGAFRAGKFYLDANANKTWDGIAGGDQFINFGISGDLPVIGDWNGDGFSDIGIIRNGKFYLDANGNRAWNNLAGGDAYFNFGTTGDKPIAGDWNNDGKSDVGIVRNGAFYLDANGNRAWNNTAGGDAFFIFGSTSDIPFVGRWILPTPAPLPNTASTSSAGSMPFSGAKPSIGITSPEIASSPPTSAATPVNTLIVPARKKRIPGEQELVDQLFAESLSAV